MRDYTHDTEYTGAGIYALVNVMDAGIYIGKSGNIQTRFAVHRSNFSRKSATNKMYSHPIEDFIFLVCHKMNDEEFGKYGAIIENLYIRYVQQKWQFKLYNDTERYDIDSVILETLSELVSPGKHLDKAFRSRIGRFSCNITRSSARTRRQLLVDAKMKEEQA